MRWVAHTNHRDELPPGSRFYILENPQVEGEPRPPYAEGDAFNIEASSGTRQAATITRVAGAELDVTITNGGRIITLRPTPPEAGEAAFRVKDDAMQFEDWSSVN